MNEFMLYTLTYLFSQALGIYSIYKLVIAFFEECIVKRYVEVSAFVGYFILSSSMYLIINIPVVNFAVNIISVFLLTFMYTSSIKKKLLVDVLTYTFMAGAEMLVVTVTGHIDFSIIERNNYHSIFGIVVINILKYVVSMALNGFKNIKNGNTLPLAYWVSLLIMPISSLFMLVVIFQSAVISIYKITLSVAAVLIINFTVFFLFDRLANSFQEKQEKEFMEQQNRYYENQLELINASLENSSILRHDMKNHLQAIFTDIKKGNINEAQQHISDITDVYNSEGKIIHTGYPAIDSIVNFKLQAAMKNGVKVNVGSTLPQGLNISSFDSTVIFGNLIDNALQAVSLVPENKFIDLDLHYSKGMLLIKVSNPFINEIKKLDGKVITTKIDNKNHGYGLTSVKETVEKYDGTIDIIPDDNIFTVKAVLYVD